MNQHTLDTLRFHDLLETVARHASSEHGKRAIRTIRPGTEAESIGAELALVADAVAVLDGDSRWAVPPIPEVGDVLGRLAKEGAVLDVDEVRRLLQVAEGASRTRRVFRGREGPVARLVRMLPDLEDLARRLGAPLDDDGIRDQATPELFRLRERLRAMRASIVDRLEKIARDLPDHARVPDASVSIRNNRYVIAVRREGMGALQGTIQDESATGATVFLEPTSTADRMNRYRITEAEERREVQRILRELTTAAREQRDDLASAHGCLVRLDSVIARGRYARGHGGTVPDISADDKIVLAQARHPLLIEQGIDVVPLDLEMDAGERTLLVSGPNAGGKTVVLTTVGLAVLAAQSGIIPPLGAGSRLPIFDRVAVDIGDEQSIEASLSTFAAHVRNLAEAVAMSGPRTLVLLDEIGTGTDPREGAALARSILVELLHEGARTLATTHLGELQTLPEEEPGVVNASMRFDTERMAASYELQKGIPGRSHGLDMARRMGLPEPVLRRAEAFLPEGERAVAELIGTLEERTAEATRQRDELITLRTETERLRNELETTRQTLRERERDAERRTRQQARDILLSARKEVDEAIRAVRAASAEEVDAAAREARRKVEAAADRQRERAPAPEDRRAPAPEISVGDRVRIGEGGTVGRVREIRDGRAQVEVGALRMEVKLRDLVPAGDAPAARPKTGVKGSFDDVPDDARPEVDLRGQRVDEVERDLSRALDAAHVANLPSFRIIHGKGTGALRERVHELLEGDPRIGVMRPGERGEGGLGVTVVEFR